MKDIVAKLPVPINLYLLGGGNKDGFELEDGNIAKFNDQYFVHCIATLPVKDFKSDFGFGLWAEVSKADFGNYLEAIENDQLYKNFECNGTLANDWPGFKGTYGDGVKIKVLDLDSKVQIVDIEPSDVELSKYIEKGSMNDKQKEILRRRIIGK